jgi:hypothetical protein
MEYQSAGPDFPASCGTICLASILLLSVLPLTTDAQVQLRADKRILLEATQGTQT